MAQGGGDLARVLFTIWENDVQGGPIHSELLGDPRNARFLSIYAHERGEAIEVLTNVGQFSLRSSLSRAAWAFPMAMKHF